MTTTTDATTQLSDASETAFRQCFVEDPATGTIRLTRKGHAEYGRIFAQAGIDIHTIRTRAALRQACRDSEWVVIEELRQMVKGHKEIEVALAPLWS